MKMNKQAATAVSLAAVLSCGLIAGCDVQITSDSQKDMQQTIAVVDLTKGDLFQAGGEFEDYANVISASKILKREMIASFMSFGYTYVNSHGYSYSDTFKLIKDSLVSRHMILQYAKAYLLKKDDKKADYVAKREIAKQEAGYDEDLFSLSYFLSEEELARALYNVRVIVNNTLDSQEKQIIKAEEREHASNVRTTPTGVKKQKKDYYDAAYRIYTGRNEATACGIYEKVEGSTATTRKRAYNAFLANLKANDFIQDGDDVSDLEKLEYFKLELKSAYEDILVEKLSEAFEEVASATLSNEYVSAKFNETLESQKKAFDNASTFESALDSASESSFVLYAPNGSYGYVINILLPFSDMQSDKLSAFEGTEGQKFVYRSQILESVKATDQRETWFTGATDYSYKGEDNKYYFFNDDATRYDEVKYYYDGYAYNGTVDYDESEKTYTVKPASVSIDDFIGIMESTLNANGVEVADNGYYAKGVPAADKSAYYAQTAEDYYKNDGNEVDYSSFVYYVGKANIDDFNANTMLTKDSTAYKAVSVINALSFAYNTDTAGLNKLYGYSVSAYDTSFVPEFEYAAKLAVQGGVGTYTIAPSTYGWHIMYCTFSYSNTTPYTYNHADKDTEGCFSNLYYEALKTSTVNGYSSAMQSSIVNANKTEACVTVYQSTYQDLLDLDN